MRFKLLFFRAWYSQKRISILYRPHHNVISSILLIGNTLENAQRNEKCHYTQTRTNTFSYPFTHKHVYVNMYFILV